MYYLSPFTYLASSMLSVGVANTKASCLDYEFLRFSPPSGQTCGQYLSSYIQATGGFVENPNATDTCSFCQISETNVFLNAVSSHYSQRWRNFGILWAYVIFNTFMALFLYWLVRVPKKSKVTKEMSGPLTGRDVVEKEEPLDTPDPTAPRNGERGSPEVRSQLSKEVGKE